MTHKQSKKAPKAIVLIIILSFIVGGLSGALFGIIGSQFLTTYLKLSSKLQFNSNNTEEKFENKKVVQVEEESQTIRVVEGSTPAVVSIIAEQELRRFESAFPDNFFDFDNFFGFPGFRFSFPKQKQGYQKETEPQKQQVSSGTGFIISEDGLILTNKHVVANTEPEYTVIMNDGKKFPAEILGRDPLNDLAVVKIKAENLPHLELGDSENIQIGQTVIAIGNTLGEYTNTVTRGVISGIGRNITAGSSRGGSEIIENAIQTDAAISSGNSGGPLLNLAGQVIGINTAVSLQGENIGFAIPSNEASIIVKSVQKHGKIVRAFLGVSTWPLSEDFAKNNNIDINDGELIFSDNPAILPVVPGSPADSAGLEANDIILEVNGAKVGREHRLYKEIAKYEVGEKIEIKIWRKEEEQAVKIVLGERQE